MNFRHRKSSRSGVGCRASAILGVFILIPVRQNIGDAWGAGQSVHILEILLRDFEGTGRHVGNIFPDQFTGIDCSFVDLLEEERSEGLDTGAQECTVEGNIDAAKRDSGEATFQGHRLWLRFGLLDTFVDDFDQVCLNILERHRLHESLNVDFLGLEDVEQVGQTVKGT